MLLTLADDWSVISLAVLLAVIGEFSVELEVVIDKVEGRLFAPNSKSTGKGGVQVASSQACALTFPIMEKLVLSSTLIRYLNVTEFVKEPISI